MSTEHNFSRRNRVDLMSTAEKTILEAGWEIEKLGADVKLTDAINLLSQARSLVADYIEAKSE